jgi:hypothetical protein
MWLPLVLAACGGPGSYAEREDFEGDARYRREYPVAAGPLCEAARRVLMGDGYGVSGSDPLALVGVKEFRLEDKGHAQVTIRAACVDRAKGATLFVAATEEHFDVKTSRQSTTVGVPVVAPISFGTRSETDSQVKTRGETVQQRDFYERFHQAVKRDLGH